MKASIWGWAIVVVGIVAIFFVYFFQNVTNTDEHNYNLLKDVTEAAMMDAVDMASYAANDVIFMDGDKFVENFVRRFAESATLSRTYVIKIYDVSEMPPKVSLQVSSTDKSSATGEIMEFDITNRLDAILESPETGPITLSTSQRNDETERLKKEYLDKIYKNNGITIPSLIDVSKFTNANQNTLTDLDRYLRTNGPCAGKNGSAYEACMNEIKNKNTNCSIYSSDVNDAKNYETCLKLDNQGKIDTKCSSLKGSTTPAGIEKFYTCIREVVRADACKNYAKGTTQYTTCINKHE